MDLGSTKILPRDIDVLAPDGSEVRICCHWLAAAWRISGCHPGRSRGRFAIEPSRRSGTRCPDVAKCGGPPAARRRSLLLRRGLCLTIPAGVGFQFRSHPAESLAAVAITMPPWPGDGEAEFVDGRWQPTVAP